MEKYNRKIKELRSLTYEKKREENLSSRFTPRINSISPLVHNFLNEGVRIVFQF